MFFAKIENQDGKLFCRQPISINQCGLSVKTYEIPLKEKLYYPDENTSLTEGIASVIVTEDQGDIGFFTGKMLSVKKPENDVLTEHLRYGISTCHRKNMFLDFSDDEYVVLFWPETGSYHLLYQTEDNIIIDVWVGKAYSGTESISVEDFLFIHFFGQTKNEVFKDFIIIELCGVKVHSSQKSPLLEEAIASELMTIYEHNGVQFIKIQEIDNALLFTKAELKRILHKANEINRLAQASL